MSSTNPYYRSAGQSDDEFAQQPSQYNINHHYKSEHEPTTINQNHQKPSFSQLNYPSIPPYSPERPPLQPKRHQNILDRFISKMKNKKNAYDLSSTTHCANCGQMSQSLIVKKNSFIVWILCIFLLITTYVCFFLPFWFDALKNRHVICKNCGHTKFVIKAF